MNNWKQRAQRLDKYELIDIAYQQTYRSNCIASIFCAAMAFAIFDALSNAPLHVLQPLRCLTASLGFAIAILVVGLLSSHFAFIDPKHRIKTNVNDEHTNSVKNPTTLEESRDSTGCTTQTEAHATATTTCTRRGLERWRQRHVLAHL